MSVANRLTVTSSQYGLQFLHPSAQANVKALTVISDFRNGLPTKSLPPQRLIWVRALKSLSR